MISFQSNYLTMAEKEAQPDLHLKKWLVYELGVV